MKNIKVSIRHLLPEELWHDILSRLPVKSVVRFSCVSKSCLKIIKDPDFCSLHLEKFKNDPDEALLFVQSSENDRVLRFRTFEELHALGRQSDDGTWQFEFAIDGLVLLKRRGRNDLKLWNPSIRKFHEIPSLPESRATDVEISLGYDRLVKDYKHVKLIFAKRDKLHSVAVYTLRAGSWKTIPFRCKGRSKWNWIREHNNMMAVYLRGSLYFIAKDIKQFRYELVSIDLSCEAFSCASLPDVGGGNVSGPLSLVDGGSRLAVFDCWRDTMWVLGSETTGWTPRCSLGFKVSGSLYHKKNGDVVIWEEGDESITLANVKESVSSDNIVTRSMEILVQTNPSFVFW